MRNGHTPDVLIVSLGATEGLRRADRALRDALRRAGVSATVVAPPAPPARRTLMLTDLAWARAARAVTLRALYGLQREPAIVYSSTTAALLWPRPGAIRFDAPASGNRPGRHGLWQRPLERRRLERAPLLLPWSEGALREVQIGAIAPSRVLVLPVPVSASGAVDEPDGAAAPETSDAPAPPASPASPASPGSPAGEEARDIAAITYAANPLKKGLDRVLEAWRRRQRGAGPGAAEELVVTGTTPAELRAAGIELARMPGVSLREGLSHAGYRALVRRARVFVTAPRREDYGIAQLEALADGAMLVTTPAPGPYVALPIARELDPRLVSENLGSGLAAALSEPRADYAERARAAIEPFSERAVDTLVAEQLLERLFG